MLRVFIGAACLITPKFGCSFLWRSSSLTISALAVAGALLRVLNVGVVGVRWFHRPFRIDDWLRFSLRGLSFQRNRALSMGHVYSPDGALCVTVIQEYLARFPEQPAAKL